MRGGWWGGYIFNDFAIFLFSWSESVGKSLPSLPHCEMREEVVGTFHPLHYLVVSAVLIAEYSEPKGKKYFISPSPPPPLLSFSWCLCDGTILSDDEGGG